MGDITEEPLNLDTQGLEILLAASQHDIQKLRLLLRTGSANFQDPESLSTPLHAAIAACGPESGSASPKNLSSTETVSCNGDESKFTTDRSGQSHDSKDDGASAESVSAAKDILNLLLQNGGIWNDLDANDETPGCIASRLHLPELYEIMVEAGVRAELLLGRLDQYQPLDDEASSDDEKEKPENSIQTPDSPSDKDQLKSDEKIETIEINDQTGSNDDSLQNPVFLTQPLQLDNHSSLVDSSSNAVMMTWETPLMLRTAELLLPEPNLRVLNVGHGLGIVDGFLQDRFPVSHHIIEAHPSVLAVMREKGLFQKKGLTIHDGRWQDVVPKLLETGVMFDAIYYDTFAESYSDFKEFMYLVDALLEEKGRWSFFCGGGADRRIVHDVWRRVVEMEMLEEGWDTEWEDMAVDLNKMEERGDWEGTKRRYWVLDKYHLPICTRLDS